MRERLENGRNPRLRGDDGMALIEAAIVLPVFFTLLFGVIDYSGVLRDYQTTNYALQVAGRIVSVQGMSADADYLTVVNTGAAALAAAPGGIQRIVIWQATDDASGVAWRKGRDSVVPPSCKTANQGNTIDRCNVFSRVARTLDPSVVDRLVWEDCASASNPARYWCSTSRRSAAQGVRGPPDLVGIYIEVLHPFSTGLFGPAMTITQQGVFSLETTSLQ